MMVTICGKLRCQSIVAMLVVVILMLAGCDAHGGMTTRTPVNAEKTGTGERRVDTDPLTRRFPLIGDPVQVVWYSGTMGLDDAPGPSTYWIDAVVTVDATTSAQIEDSYDLQPTNDVPDVVAPLSPDIPSGLWTSDEFDKALVQGGDPQFSATAYYSPATHQIVICAVGG